MWTVLGESLTVSNIVLEVYFLFPVSLISYQFVPDCVASDLAYPTYLKIYPKFFISIG
jgi:hypothetical protein